MALLSLDRLAHGGLLGLCGGSAGFFRVLLTLEGVAKVLEAHSESDVDERCSDVEEIKDAEFWLKVSQKAPRRDNSRVWRAHKYSGVVKQ